MSSLGNIPPRHAAALDWFAARAGQEVEWPKPLDGLFLVNKAKGIHKPAELSHALSIRQSLNGPYEDVIHLSPDDRWVIDYAQEGSDPSSFTNVGLRQCLKDKIPVGVIVQIKGKPSPRYRILGLGDVTDENDGVFTVQQAGSGIGQIEAAMDVSLAPAAFDSSNKQDGRERILRAIALRRGQPKFRKALLTAYQGTCAMTGCAFGPVLEAAHIIPYLGDHTNHVNNGLLLRADIHTLFDLGLIAVESDTYLIRCSNELAGTDYAILDGRKLSLPIEQKDWPSKDALKNRMDPSGVTETTK